MRYIKRSVLGLLLVLIVATGKAQTADEIVANYIDAIGGAGNWKKVNSIFYQGKLKVHGAEIDIYKTVLHSKGMRQNISSSMMTAFTINTPSEGWEYLPYKGQEKPEQVHADIVRLNADQYDAQGVLIDYKAKGHSIDFMGKETIDGKEYYKLQVKHKSGKEETLYFDIGSGLLLRSVVKQYENGKVSYDTTKFSNYQRHSDGILFPMTIELPIGEVNITKLEINKAVNENIFKPID